MFIREVTHKNKNNNTMYSTYKIVESYRTERGPRQHTILNLGANFNLPADQWDLLSQSIEEIITGQQTLIGYSEEIESLAKMYAGKIIQQQACVVETKKDSSPDVGKVLNQESDEIELYCHSTGKEKKEEAIKTAFMQRFEDELKKANESISKKSGIKCYDKVVERIGRLKERFKRIAYRYAIEIKKDDKTNKAESINWHQKETKEKKYGVYCLRTNIKDGKEQEIWDIYNMLTDIEDAFCSMKSELGLRPVYHQKQARLVEARVDGHLFITVLAYHILHTIRFKLRQKKICYDWKTIRNLLSTHVRITTSMKTKGGKMIHIRKSCQAEPFHKQIYNALNLPSQPGKTIKTIL